MVTSVEKNKAYKKIFIYDDAIPNPRRAALSKTITNLGGQSLNFEEQYVSHATHVIVQDEELKVICPKLLGCLASRKHVVSCSYIYSSKKEKQFLRELDYAPKGLVQEIYPRLLGKAKAFIDLKCLIFLKDKQKQHEFTRILRDGGAFVPNWTMKDLIKKDQYAISKIDKIFTEPYFVKYDKDFQLFITNERIRNNLQSKIQVFSYFYLFKFVLGKPEGGERKKLEECFDIENSAVIGKIHNLKNTRRVSQLIYPNQLSNKVPEVEIQDDITDALNEEEIIVEDTDDIQIIPNDTIENKRYPKTIVSASKINLSNLETERNSVQNKNSGHVENKTNNLRYTRHETLNVVDSCKIDESCEIINDEITTSNSVVLLGVDCNHNQNLSTSKNERKRSYEIVSPVESSQNHGLLAEKIPRKEMSPIPGFDRQRPLSELNINGIKALPDTEGNAEAQVVSSILHSLISNAEILNQDTKEKRQEPLVEISDFTPYHNTLTGLKEKSMVLMISELLAARQKLTNECIDISNARERTNKFDARNEACFKSYQMVAVNDKKRRPISLQLNEMDTTKFFNVVFHCTEYINEKNCTDSLLICVESLRSVVCSYFYPRAQTLHKVIRRILMTFFQQNDVGINELKEDEFDMRCTLIHQTKELLQDLLFLHPPIDKLSRIYYLSVFQCKYNPHEQNLYIISNNVWLFLESLIKDKFSDEGKFLPTKFLKDNGKIETLVFVVDVFQKDIEYWWKHQKNKKNDCSSPMVKWIMGATPTYYNEKRLEYILKCYSESINKKNKTYETIFRKFISMFALYCSKKDLESGFQSLDDKRSLKFKFSTQVFLILCKSKGHFRNCNSERLCNKRQINPLNARIATNIERSITVRKRLNETHIMLSHFYCLRPAWLSLTMVLSAATELSVDISSNKCILSLSNWANKTKLNDYNIGIESHILMKNAVLKEVLLENTKIGKQHNTDGNNNIAHKLVSLAIDKYQAIYPSISMFIVLFNTLKLVPTSQKLRFKGLKVKELTENYGISKKIGKLDEKKGWPTYKNKIRLDSCIAISLEAVLEDLELCKKLYLTSCESGIKEHTKCSAKNLIHLHIMRKFPIRMM